MADRVVLFVVGGPGYVHLAAYSRTVKIIVVHELYDRLNRAGLGKAHTALG